MGRGRAKAKQQKVARSLKYSTPATDLSALERELHNSTRNGVAYPVDDADDLDEDDADDEYADEDADDDGDDDYEKWATGQR